MTTSTSSHTGFDMSVDSINICNNIDLCDAFQQNPGFVSLILQEKNDMIQIIQKARSTITETFDKTPHNLKVTATACYADEENIHKTSDEILSTEQLFYKYASFRGLGVLSALATRSRAYQERLSRLPKSSQRVVCEDLKEHALSESLAGFIDKVRSKVIGKKKSKTAARSRVVFEHSISGSHLPESTHTVMASTEQERATHEIGSTSSKRSTSAHNLNLEHEEPCLKKQKRRPSEEAVLPSLRNNNGRNEEREWMPPAAVPNPILSISSEPESNGASLWHDHVLEADRHNKLIEQQAAFDLWDLEAGSSISPGICPVCFLDLNTSTDSLDSSPIDDMLSPDHEIVCGLLLREGYF